MLVKFQSMEITTFLQVRCGIRTGRKRRIDPEINQIDIPPVRNCALELVDGFGHVWQRKDIIQPGKVVLTYEGPPTADNLERPETQDNDQVLEVGGRSGRDGETLLGTIHVQVPSVDKGDARLNGSEECGPKSSPNGLHGSNDEQDVLDNRHETGERTLPTSNKDSRRD